MYYIFCSLLEKKLPRLSYNQHLAVSTEPCTEHLCEGHVCNNNHDLADIVTTEHLCKGVTPASIYAITTMILQI